MLAVRRAGKNAENQPLTFLKKAEALVKRLATKQPDEAIPAALHGKREATVIYNNLPRILAMRGTQVAGVAEPRAEYGDERLRLALEIDRVMRERAPAGWKGDQGRGKHRYSTRCSRFSTATAKRPSGSSSWSRTSRAIDDRDDPAR